MSEVPTRRAPRRRKPQTTPGKKINRKYFEFKDIIVSTSTPNLSNSLTPSEASYFYDDISDSITFIDPRSTFDFQSYERILSDDDGCNSSDDDSSRSPPPRANVVASSSISDTYTPAINRMINQAQVSIPTPKIVGWQTLFDEASQAEYYYSPITQETLWEKPQEMVESERQASKWAHGKFAYDRNRRLEIKRRKKEAKAAKKAEELETTKEEVHNNIHEGFYAPKEIRRRAEDLNKLAIGSRTRNIEIANQHLLNCSLLDSCAALRASRNAGSRSKQFYIKLANTHFQCWNDLLNTEQLKKLHIRQQAKREKLSGLGGKQHVTDYNKKKIRDKLLIVALEAYETAYNMRYPLLNLENKVGAEVGVLQCWKTY